MVFIFLSFLRALAECRKRQSTTVVCIVFLVFNVNFTVLTVVCKLILEWTGNTQRFGDG